MTIGWKVCGAVAAIVLVGLLIWRRSDDVLPGKRDAVAALDAPADTSPARAPRAGRGLADTPDADGAVPGAASADGSVAHPARWLRVVDERGVPLPGASGTVLGEERSPGVVEADGRVRLPAVAASRRALVVVPGRPPLVVEVPGGEGQTDIVLPGGASIEGVVHIDGVPAREGVVLQFGYADNRNFVGEEASVAISPHYAQGFEPHRVGVLTGDGGRFRIDGLPEDGEGGLRIPDWLAFRGGPVSLRATDVAVPSGALLLDLVAFPRIRGRVVSAGRPAAGAFVRIQWTEADGGESSRTRVVAADGAFLRAVEAFGVREAKVVVSDAEQRSEREIPLGVVAGGPPDPRSTPGPGLALPAITDLGDIEIGSTTPLALRVVDRGGNPVAGAVVLAAPRGTHREGTTDANGVLELAGVGGRASVVVAARGFVPATATWTVSDGADAAEPAATRVAPHEIVLDAAPVLRVVYDPGAATTARGNVKLRIDGPPGLFPDATDIAGQALHAAGSSPVVGLYHRPEGVTQWYGLESGSHAWHVWDLRAETPFRYSAIDDYGTRVAVGEATLAPGERRDLTICATGAPRRISVTVTDADGRPISGAAVRVSDAAPTDEAGPQLTYLPSDTAGRAEFPGFRAGRAAVRVEHPGRAAWVDPGLVVGADGAAITVRMAPERGLVVRVVDEKGAPVAGADVEVSPPRMPQSGAAFCGWNGEEVSDGVHAVAGVPEGALDVAAVHADGREGRAEIAAGATEVTVVLRGAE